MDPETGGLRFGYAHAVLYLESEVQLQPAAVKDSPLYRDKRAVLEAHLGRAIVCRSRCRAGDQRSAARVPVTGKGGAGSVAAATGRGAHAAAIPTRSAVLHGVHCGGPGGGGLLLHPTRRTCKPHPK